MGKLGKFSEDESMLEEEESKSYNELSENVSCIAQPLASEKLAKKLYKAIKKASKKKMVRRGVKEIQKFVRKGERGFVVFAGDITPIEVMCHLPCVCEENKIPYAYVPSKHDLGSATGIKRPTCCIMVKPHEDYQDAYDKCHSTLKALPLPI
ncbi:H/ACA ribonucleoprotein complex subunit 2-like protein [Anneissia japonica]|uniref:H/ACA ribonucleoprotein complex subunit 2-like protein n=1 Tax=Anneissia japonica TaxID=1529436 RepID=UPI0014257941|nr:H/ACA ribonucleoprotein complex subunit 2-like protein [Anneissia japonica]